MTMTAEEIVRHWRQAKKQDANELKVLADLNSTDRDTIRKVLEGAGEPVPRRQSRLRGDELRKAIEELYGQGLSDAEIARHVGCTNTTVATWRKERDLPRNTEPGWPKKEPETPAHASALPEIYGQLESLLAVLPEDASGTVRRRAVDLLSDMFGEYLVERLKLREGKHDETD